jgi:hypothetical protein
MIRFKSMVRFFSSRDDRRVQSIERPLQKLPPRRRTIVFEPLESRLLLSVDFLAAAPAVPLINHVDVPVGTLSPFGFEEPNLTINNRGDAGNILITSHNGSAASTNMFVTDSNGVFPSAPGANRGDTWADFDTTGRAWWTNLEVVRTPPPPANPELEVRVVEVNPTTGQPIGNGTIVNTPPAGQSDDRQALAVDSFPNSRWQDNIYVIWTRFGVPAPSRGTEVFVAVSSDQGATWTTTPIGDSNGPDNIPNNADDEGFGQQVHIAVDNNGDVWAAYHAQPGFGAGGNPDGTSGHVRLFRSTDGGITWNATASLPFTNGQADITFNRQEAAGLPTSIPGTDFLTQGSVQPYVLPDPARDNQVYVIAADDTDNNHGASDDSDLYIARSVNNGATWTRTLLPHGDGTNFQLFPTAAIDQFGDMVVTWYDNRRGLPNDGPDNILGNADDNFLLDWMGMYSVDGGVAWSAPFRINDAPFDPDETPITLAPPPTPSIPSLTTRIGEYFGLDLFGGTAYVAFNGNTPGDNTTSQQVFFDAFPISGALTVNGDDGNTVRDDDITLHRIAGNNDFIEVRVNNNRQYTGLREAVTNMTVRGFGGNDTLTLDFTNGDPIPTSLVFDGGDGATNRLLLSGGSVTDEIYIAGGPRLGVLRLDPSSVGILNVASIDDVISATNFTFEGTGAADQITVADGPLVEGFQTGTISSDNRQFIPFSFANKTLVAANGNRGSDAFTVNLGTQPASLTRLSLFGQDAVNAADDDAADSFTLKANAGVFIPAQGGGGGDIFNVAGGGITAGGSVLIDGGDLTGVDTLNVNGQGLDYTLTNTSFFTPDGRDILYVDVEALGLSDSPVSGTFLVASNIRADVTVNDNATLKGKGTIQGALEVNFGGAVDPGDRGAPSTLGAGDTTFNAGSVFFVDLRGTAPGQHDLLEVTGAVVLDGAHLRGSLGFAAQQEDTLVIVRNDGADAVVGRFAQGNRVTIGGRAFGIDYAFDANGDGNHNDIALVRLDSDDQISEASQTSVGSTFSSAIEAPKDVDMVKFTVWRGQRVGFDVDRAAGSTLDSFIRLFNAQGVQLASNNDGAAPGEGGSTSAYLEFTFSTAGTFYLGVSANPNRTYNPRTGTGDVAGGSTGGYRLTLTDLTRRTVSAPVAAEELAG